MVKKSDIMRIVSSWSQIFRQIRSSTASGSIRFTGITSCMKKIVTITCLCLLINADQIHSQAKSFNKPRTIVTTDGEVDDQDSFIRLLLYSNEMNIEGLVYTSSQWHYRGDGKGTLFISEMKYTADHYGKRAELRWIGIDWMQNLIDKYAKVYPN